MLKLYKNALFAKIEELVEGSERLDMTMFQGMETGSANAFVIRFLVNTELFFRVQDSGSSYHEFHGYYSVFDPQYTRREFGLLHNVDFAGVITQLEDWIEGEVSTYIDECHLPDLWSQLESQKTLVSAAPPQDQDTSMFSEAEKVQVRLGVQEFRSLIAENFEPQDEEMRVIDARLQYLTEAVDRLNRFDWKALAIATLIGIATTLTLDTQKGAMLLALFQQAMRAVTHFLPG